MVPSFWPARENMLNIKKHEERHLFLYCFVAMGNVKASGQFDEILTVNPRNELCGAFVNLMNVSMFNYTEKAKNGKTTKNINFRKISNLPNFIRDPYNSQYS